MGLKLDARETEDSRFARFLKDNLITGSQVFTNATKGFGGAVGNQSTHRSMKRESLRKTIEHIFIPVVRDSTSLSKEEEWTMGTGRENLLALVVISPKIKMIEACTSLPLLWDLGRLTIDSILMSRGMMELSSSIGL